VCLIAGGLLCLLTACSSRLHDSPVTPPLVPRITPLPSWNVCDSRDRVLLNEAGRRTERVPWGIGEEVTIYRQTAGHESEYHLFFDDRSLLVGYIGLLYDGIDLADQPGYTAWVAQQIPTEFLLPAGTSGGLPDRRSGQLYDDQGARVSARAIVIPQNKRPMLVIESNVLSAYALLLSPYKPAYLTRILRRTEAVPGPAAKPDAGEGRDFLSRQSFSNGEAAHFGLCGAQAVDVAITAYQRAIEIGLSEPLYQAEAHHRLGLAYRDKGLLPQAAAAIETSLTIRPAIPDVVNHLGKVYALMGDTIRAMDAFQRAIGLKPNYANAHFNLAELLEDTQPRRAIIAYENYLAYTEPTTGEAARIEQAEKRVEALRKAGKY